MCAVPHRLVIDGEVSDAAPELEKRLPRVTIPLVLLDCILDGLLRQVVLQLEGSDRQAIDERAQIERQLRLVTAVAKLAGHAEAVFRILLLSLAIPWGWRPEEQREVVGTMAKAMPQDINRASLSDLSLQA